MSEGEGARTLAQQKRRASEIVGTLLADDGEMREILLALWDAGIEPAVIYAFQKTGRVVHEGNEGALTPRELEEWYRYFAEYEPRRKFDPEIEHSFDRFVAIAGEDWPGDKR